MKEGHKARKAVQGQWRSTRTHPDNTGVNAHSACKKVSVHRTNRNYKHCGNSSSAAIWLVMVHWATYKTYKKCGYVFTGSFNGLC